MLCQRFTTKKFCHWFGQQCTNLVQGEYTGVIEKRYVQAEPNSIYGDIISFETHDVREDDYLLHLNGYTFINAKECGNELRFVNDYRWIGKANVTTKREKEHVYFVTSRDIIKDEELLIDYGIGYWVVRRDRLSKRAKMDIVVDYYLRNATIIIVVGAFVCFLVVYT